MVERKAYTIRIKMYILLVIVSMAYNTSSAMGSQTAGSTRPVVIDSLWRLYSTAPTDSLKMTLLIRLAFFYSDYLEDESTSDSLAEAAIRIAEVSLNSDFLLYAYNGYLESTSSDRYYEKALGYANKAMQNCRITGKREMHWRTCRNLVKVYLSKYDYRNALIMSNEALSLANKMQDERRIAESYLLTGLSHENGNQKLEAFRNYLVAMEMASRINDADLLITCYSQLSSFYRDNTLYDDAVDNKRKEGRLLMMMHPVDSVAFAWTQYDLQLIDMIQGGISLNEQSVKGIIDFAARYGHQRLKNWEFALYRQYLLENDNVTLLYKLYNQLYPEEFRSLKDHDKCMYYRLMAFFKELERKTDSAEYYFDQAQTLILAEVGKGNIFRANFFNRYGQFLLRHNRKQEAIGKFSIAYTLCDQDKFYGRFKYMLVSTKYLRDLYNETGDYRNALKYAMAYTHISDSLNTIMKKDQVITEAVKREREMRQLAAEKDQQKIRQGKAQRNMMAIGVGVLGIFILVVYRNYRNQKRLNRLLDEERKKSEQLLLNILPQETAEELKATGKARAKRFEEVTVMFTDFKNFTQASERMSAEDLVSEINFYFSAFDRIIAQHNIEKIKIIGDSYMCAGGLPVPNITHPFDVVSAALELQAFILKQRDERSARGEPWFELRIGIHTGPVIAGIVGINKFAYDIWGDTVNTASRMESSGEPNKVNISGETYQRVKHRFQCTYRGKVQAKHKGEIDMYFVEPG